MTKEVIKIEADEETKKTIDAIALRTGMSVSEVISKAVEEVHKNL